MKKSITQSCLVYLLSAMLIISPAYAKRKHLKLAFSGGKIVTKAQVPCRLRGAILARIAGDFFAMAEQTAGNKIAIKELGLAMRNVRKEGEQAIYELANLAQTDAIFNLPLHTLAYKLSLSGVYIDSLKNIDISDEEMLKCIDNNTCDDKCLNLPPDEQALYIKETNARVDKYKPQIMQIMTKLNSKYHFKFQKQYYVTVECNVSPDYFDCIQEYEKQQLDHFISIQPEK